MSMYVAPVFWVALGVLALVRMVGVIWLVIVGEFRPMLLPSRRFVLGAIKIILSSGCPTGPLSDNSVIRIPFRPYLRTSFEY